MKRVHCLYAKQILYSHTERYQNGSSIGKQKHEKTLNNKESESESEKQSLQQIPNDND